MKHFFLLITLLFSFIYSFNAQLLQETEKATITWGDEIKEKNGTLYNEVIAATKEKIYLVKSTKNNKYIEVRDDKMNPIKDVKINFDNGFRSELNYEGVFQFGNNFIILGSYSDKRIKTNALFYKKIEIDKLKDDSNWVKVGEMVFDKKRQNGYFSYELSPNKSVLLLYFSKPFLGKGSIEKFGFQIFDKTMDKLWERDVELSNNGDFFAVEDFIISNNAEVYVLGKSNEYHVLSYSNYEETKDFELDLGDRDIKDAIIGFNPKGNMICTGLFGYDYGIKGTFYLAVDTDTKKVISKNTKEFDEDFITQDWSKRRIKKAEKNKEKKGREIEAYNYNLQDLILYDDGSVTLLAEQYHYYVTYSTTTSSQGQTRTTTTRHYVYDDILIINISAIGDIEWISKIDKNQHSTNDYGYRSSYALHKKENKLYVIYNLTAKSYFDHDYWRQLSKKGKRSYLTLISEINEKGKITNELLLNNSEEKTWLTPKLCEYINDNKSFIYTSRGKYIRLGILDFKK